MPVTQASPRVFISYPDDWRIYRQEAQGDRNHLLKKLGLPERAEGNAFTPEELRGLVCDTSGTLLDYGDKPIPGIEELLKALREKAEFKRIEVASGGSDSLSIINSVLGNTGLVDSFIYINGKKRGYAVTIKSAFVLEDDGASRDTRYLLSAITPYRQVWNMGLYLSPPQYDNELIDGIVTAYSTVRTELEKL